MDTDVVVLAVANEAILGPVETWIGFGTGKDFHYIPVHEIAAKLHPNVCYVLPLFHALIGCDTYLHSMERGEKLHGKHGRLSQS